MFEAIVLVAQFYVGPGLRIIYIYMCVCVCVCERERERERESVCVCVCKDSVDTESTFGNNKFFTYTIIRPNGFCMVDIPLYIVVWGIMGRVI